jgi:glycosyltransferase involved in cell wall biosynthesis
MRLLKAKTNYPKSSKKLVVGQFFRKKINGAYSVERYFDDIRYYLKDDLKIKVFENPYPSRGVINKIINIVVAIFRNCDINHISGDIHYITLLMNKKKTILTVLDCNMMERLSGFKRLIFWIFWLWLPEKRCKIITVISLSSKLELLKYLNCDPNKIKVIPCCVSNEFIYSKKEFKKQKPVILQIGTFPNKNIERLIFSLENIECSLVIVGRLTNEHLNLLKKYKIDFTNYVNISRDQLVERYYEADIVAFISTYEGFGLPIIEANAVGRVVVTSNILSMPEVANGSACLVNPFNIQSIRDGILKVIDDDGYREKLIIDGRINATKYSAKKIAYQYKNLYAKLQTFKKMENN